VLSFGCYSRACDLFSAGVLAHVLLTAKVPYAQPMSTLADVSEHAQQRIRGLLEDCYTRRTTAQEV